MKYTVIINNTGEVIAEFTAESNARMFFEALKKSVSEVGCYYGYGLFADYDRLDEIKRNPSIEDLDLSVRAYNVLKRKNINTADDIRKMTVDELISIRNLGVKSAMEVVEKCACLGNTNRRR